MTSACAVWCPFRDVGEEILPSKCVHILYALQIITGRGGREEGFYPSSMRLEMFVKCLDVSGSEPR